ncbi:hypothetical protein AKJ37_06535 [candidate division MSBL1 archaeon SCGC-AAA259I09]|uniref:ABC transporter domain-containing protein n=1 Tax=candidate division MSBL1 archaeon SCGC-AAA259I09 TaxID=1698267 RepID=A0A133UNP9_9EURY|nr:hypothetical protein AKJ37_06535 [candidate division MSBL1 archaeon SCGC-AAA259I09]
MSEAKLEAKNITKRFPGVLALNNVNFGVKKGEVHALLGENGAGKTTLVNCIFGLFKPDSGELFINGEKCRISPNETIEKGIGMVHQNFSLVPNLSVGENIIIGAEGFKLELKRNSDRIRELGKKYNLFVNPTRKVEELSTGEKQKVEILKALFKGAEILILDEPTDLLAEREKKTLFETIEKMKKGEKSIIFITHKLDEVLEISDRVSVLRNGEKVGTFKTEEVNRKKLAKLMVGKEVIFDIEKTHTKKGELVLMVNNLAVEGNTKISSLKNLSFNIREGEIYSIAGVAGNGQTELVEALIGLRKAKEGNITIGRDNLTNKEPLEIIESGVACIPEDRENVGFCKNRNIQENILLKKQENQNFKEKRILLKEESIKNYASEIVSSYRVKVSNINQPVNTLSGGNIQRLLVGRELNLDYRLLIAHNPTRGLDVDLQNQIRKRLLEATEEDKAVLLVSSNLDEILMLSDRIGVIYEGEIIEETRPKEINKEKLGLLISGVKNA